MELTKDIVYVEESSFSIIPVAIKDILVMHFFAYRYNDGVWATAAVHCRGRATPLEEPRLFWIDPLDKQDLSKESEKMTANIFPQSDFFRVALGNLHYLVIYGPEVNITKDQITFKNKEDSNIVFQLDPKISWKFQEAFRDWKKNQEEEQNDK